MRPTLIFSNTDPQQVGIALLLPSLPLQIARILGNCLSSAPLREQLVTNIQEDGGVEGQQDLLIALQTYQRTGCAYSYLAVQSAHTPRELYFSHGNLVQNDVPPWLLDRDSKIRALYLRIIHEVHRTAGAIPPPSLTEPLRRTSGYMQGP